MGPPPPRAWARPQQRIPLARPWRRLLVEAIARYGTERGYPPSFRDLVKATGPGSSTSGVWHWLEVCEREGLLVRERGRARALALTAAGRALANSLAERESPPGAGAASGRAT